MSETTEQATEIVKRENPLLKRKNKFPGETFRLPSMGRLYFNGELDEEVKDGELVVYPMTTLDEIYMKTPDMLFQGSAIETVFKRCIPQVKKPTKLFANDVDFLLTCLRKVSYGDYITVPFKCMACEKEKVKEHEYNIPLNFFIQSSKSFTDADIEGMSLKLSSGEYIMLRPSTFMEMMSIMQINEMDIKTPEEMNDLLVKSLASVVRSVDGVSEKEFIEEWLATLPTKIVTEFSTDVERLNRWGPKFDYTIQCQDCGKDQKISTVLNPLYFFMLPSKPTTSLK